jgi:hypothetical protein
MIKDDYEDEADEDQDTKDTDDEDYEDDDQDGKKNRHYYLNLKEKKESLVRLVNDVIFLYILKIF